MRSLPSFVEAWVIGPTMIALGWISLWRVWRAGMAGFSTALGFAAHAMVGRRGWMRALHLSVGLLTISVGVVWLGRSLV